MFEVVYISVTHGCNFWCLILIWYQAHELDVDPEIYKNIWTPNKQTNHTSLSISARCATVSKRLAFPHDIMFTPVFLYQPERSVSMQSKYLARLRPPLCSEMMFQKYVFHPTAFRAEEMSDGLKILDE